MQLWIYLVLCFGFVFRFITCSDCGNTNCTLKEWIVTDCEPCCAMNASPISAVQKRSLCCPGGYGLAKCISYCKFTNDEVEQKGQCTVHCQPNCTGGFHFATTISTTTTQTTKTTTTTPTTTTISTQTTSTSTATKTTSTTATTTRTAQTTSVPTIISTVSPDFYPVYLSRIKKPLGEKSTDPKACTTRNNHFRAGFPLLVWLPLLGVLVGSVATVCIFWISRRKHRKVSDDTKPSVKRNGPVVPIYNTAYDKDVKTKTISNNTTGKRKTPNSFGNNLAF